MRILTEPENALLKQYRALLGAEGVDLSFSDDAIGEIARDAERVNSALENIGARRLHTILERLLEDLSFAGPRERGQVDPHRALRRPGRAGGSGPGRGPVALRAVRRGPAVRQPERFSQTVIPSERGTPLESHSVSKESLVAASSGSASRLFRGASFFWSSCRRLRQEGRPPAAPAARAARGLGSRRSSRKATTPS